MFYGCVKKCLYKRKKGGLESPKTPIFASTRQYSTAKEVKRYRTAVDSQPIQMFVCVWFLLLLLFLFSNKTNLFVQKLTDTLEKKTNWVKPHSKYKNMKILSLPFLSVFFYVPLSCHSNQSFTWNQILLNILVELHYNVRNISAKFYQISLEVQEEMSLNLC